MRFARIFLHLSFITFLTIIIWYKTLNQGLWGDGFYWFNPTFRNKVNIFPINLNHTYYNVLSRKIFDIIIPLFRDKMIYYQILQIIFLIALTITIYFIVFRLTKKMLIAISASIIFVSNYGGVYEMIAEGNFNRFLERIPNLILVIIGIFFLVSFLEKKKIKDFLISWFLFSFGIYLGQFASFVLPFYIFLPIFYLFDIKKPVRTFLQGSLLALSFIIPDFLIIRNSDQRSGYSFKYYLNPNVKFIQKTFLMTAPLIIPQEIVINIAKNWPSPGMPYPYVPLVAFYTIILIILSIIIGYYLYKNNLYFFKIYMACIFTILMGTALMIYTDPIKYDPYKNFQAGREVFVQSIFYAIALSIVIITFLEKHKKIFAPLLILFLSIFVIYNTNLSWQQIDANQYQYQGNSLFFSYIKNLWPQFNSQTVVILGTKLMDTSPFLNDFYSPPNVNFVTTPEDIAKYANKQNKENTYVIDVNYNPTPDGYYSPERVKIDDFTDLYRSTNNLDLPGTWGTKPVTYFEDLTRK